MLLSQESGGLLARQSEHHYRLGLRHVQSGDFQSAEREYRKAIEMDSTDVRPRDGLGFIYALQNRFREAEAEFERVTGDRPRLCTVPLQAGKDLPDPPGSRKSEGCLRKSNRIRADVLPRSSRARHNLLAGGKTDRGGGALQDGAPAQIRLRPARYRLGAIYLQQQEYAKAIEELQQAAKLVENESSVHYVLGDAYMAIGRLSEAADAFAVTLRLDPRRADAHDKLGLVYTEQSHVPLGAAMTDQDKLAAAVEEHRKAVALAPDNGWFQHNLGMAYERQRNYEGSGGAVTERP